MDSKQLNKILAVLLGLALVYIVFLQGCGNRTTGGDSVVTSVDTVLIEVLSVDTIVVTNTNTEYKYISVLVPAPFKDTSSRETVKTVDLFDDLLSENPWVYVDTIADDTMSLNYWIRSWGYIDSISIGYRPLKEYYIENRSLVKVETTKEKNLSFYGGLNAGMNDSGLSFLEPNIELLTPKMGYKVGYDIVNRSVIGGVKFRLRWKR